MKLWYCLDFESEWDSRVSAEGRQPWGPDLWQRQLILWSEFVLWLISQLFPTLHFSILCLSACIRKGRALKEGGALMKALLYINQGNSTRVRGVGRVSPCAWGSCQECVSVLVATQMLWMRLLAEQHWPLWMLIHFTKVQGTFAYLVDIVYGYLWSKCMLLVKKAFLLTLT